MILVVCLNPALQRMIWLDSLQTGEVNRAGKVVIGLGGKGVNVARVLAQLGSAYQLLLPLGGYTGQVCQQLLTEANIHFHAVMTDCPTRICTTLLHQDGQTEIVEEGGPVTVVEFQQIRQAYLDWIGQVQMVIISGSAANGIPDNFYLEMVAWAVKKGIPCILDAQKQALMQGLAGRPWLAKPNLKELIAAMADTFTEKTSVQQRLKWLLERGAEMALVSDGPQGAYYFNGKEYGRIYGPALQPVNAIGSGDALCAGLADHYLKEKNMDQAMEFGIACAMSNVLTPVSGMVDLVTIPELLKQVRRQILKY